MRALNRVPILVVLGLLPAWLQAASLQSNGDGDWFNALTWSPAQVPTSADDVTVRSNNLVTVTGLGAQAKSVTVSVGTLKFSTAAASSLSLAQGDLTVGPGGALTLGTPALPLPAGVVATLTLAPKSGGSVYGLVVKAGGSFISQGAAKVPAAWSIGNVLKSGNTLQVADADAAGWSAIDTLSIGQTEMPASFQDQTERRTITSLSSSGGVTTVTLSASPTYDHLSANGGVRVVNLTRNVVIRSAGSVPSNSSYVRAEDSSSFSAALTEFVSLGNSAGVPDLGGLALYTGAISSCSVRDGYYGVDARSGSTIVVSNTAVMGHQQAGVQLDPFGTGDDRLLADDIASNGGAGVGTGVFFAGGATVSGSFLYSNHAEGADLRGNNTLFTSNLVSANQGNGLYLSDSFNYVSSSTFRAGKGDGVDVNGTGNVLSGNTASKNAGIGFFAGGTGGHLFVSNQSMDNAQGLVVQAPDITFARNMVGLNNGAGAFVNMSGAVAFVESLFGYDASGAAQPEQSGAAELYLFSVGKLVLKGARVNPLGDVTDPNGAPLLFYNHNFATGTVRMSGAVSVAPGDPLILDRALPTWRSTATAAVLLRGTGHAASVSSTDDNNAVTQLVSVRCVSGAANQWVVEGSVSGTMFGPFTGGLSGQSVGGQLSLTFTPGGARQTDDRVSFLLVASSRDGARQKRLSFMGPGGLTVQPGASLSLSGTSSEPTLMDVESGVSPYLFVSSGTLDMENAAASNMASSGLRLTGTGGVTMSSVTFDSIGSGAGGAYLVANSLASNATFYNMAFKDTPNRQPFNVKVQGTDSALRWFFAAPVPAPNPRWGDTKDSDPDQKVLWADALGPQPVTLAAASGSNTGEVSLSWTATLDREDQDPTTVTSPFKGGHYRLYRSTDAAARNASVTSQAQIVLPATTTAAGTAWSVTDSNLPLQTEYYRLWAVDELGNAVSSDASAAPARVTPGTAFNFQAALTGSTEITLTWTHPANPPAMYRGDYLLEYSTVSPAGPWTAVPGTVLASSTSYKHQGLANNKTYYYQLTTTDNGAPPLSSVPAGPASATTADTATPQVTLEAGPGLGAKAVGLSWGTSPVLTFSKAMDPVAVGSAVALTAKVDHLGNPMSSTVTVAAGWDPGDTVLTLTPGTALLSNTVYELTITTDAADAVGKPLASSSTLRFVTMMDHTVHNVVTQGAGGASIDVPPMALSQDGFIAGASLPESQVSPATQKLVSASGDPLRRPVAGDVVQLDAFNGAGALQSGAFAGPVTVSFPYSDAAKPGFVDGAFPPAPVKALSVYWLNESRNLWVRLPSSVDPAGKTVSAQAPHFTTFALMIQSDADLSEAHPYPSPWTPRSGRSTVTFTGVGQGATLRIYTLEGALVRRLSAPDASGEMDWDLKSESGAPVATGVYLYEVSNDKDRKTGAFGVVR